MLLLMLLSVAFGAEWVVYSEGSPAEALANAGRATGLPETDLKPTTLHDLVAKSRPVVIGGDVRTCAGPATDSGTVDDLVKKAYGSILYGETVKALTLLEDAHDAVLCAVDEVSWETLAKIEFLRGNIALSNQEKNQATPAFSAARRLGMRDWDPNFSPENKAYFDAAGQTAPTIELHFVPSSADFEVDSTPVKRSVAQVSAEEHAIRANGRLFAVNVSGPATMVVPALLQSEVLDHLGDPEARRDVSTVLAAVVEPGARVHLVHADDVWSGSAGTLVWQRTHLDPIETEVIEVAEDDDLRLRNPNRWVIGAGTMVTVLGGTGIGANYAWSRRIQKDATATMDEDNAIGLAAQHKTAETFHGVAVGVTALGVAMLATGVTMQLLKANKTARPTPWISGSRGRPLGWPGN